MPPNDFDRIELLSGGKEENQSLRKVNSPKTKFLNPISPRRKMALYFSDDLVFLTKFGWSFEFDIVNRFLIFNPLTVVLRLDFEIV